MMRALEIFVDQVKNFGDDMGSMVSLVNLYKRPLDQKVLKFYHELKNRKENAGKNIFKIISQELEDYNISFSELVNREVYEYENV